MASRIFSLLGCITLLGSAALAQPTINSISPAVAPGSLLSIFGSGLASGLSLANSVPISTTLSDVNSVTINGMAAPLMFVSDSQISAQVPWEVTPGPASVIVNRTASSSQPMPVQVNAYAPSVTALGLGTLQALATNADGTLTAGPTAGFSAHPATAGDTITLFASGLGAVNPPPLDGANSSDTMRQCAANPSVVIGGAAAQVPSCILSPQFVGVYQVSVVVPSGVTAGAAVPVQLQAPDGSNANPVTIALQ